LSFFLCEKRQEKKVHILFLYYGFETLSFQFFELSSFDLKIKKSKEEKNQKERKQVIKRRIQNLLK
jgi:hypothetical protein